MEFGIGFSSNISISLMSINEMDSVSFLIYEGLLISFSSSSACLVFYHFP